MKVNSISTMTGHSIRRVIMLHIAARVLLLKLKLKCKVKTWQK